MFIGDNAKFNPVHITLQAWVKADYAGSFRGVVTKRNCCVNTTEQWTLQTNNGKMAFGINVSGFGEDFATDIDLVPVGIWTQFTGTYDGSVAKLYKNGTLVAQTITQGGDILSLPWSVYVGDRDGDNDPWPGAIDEVRIWDKALTQTEIQSNINCALTGKELRLIAYYNFNQGIAGDDNTGITTLKDLSANHLDGILQNFTLNGVTSNWISDAISTSPCIPSASVADKAILEGNTSTKQLKFPVTLNKAYTSPVKIKYKTFNNTATAGSDYVAKQGVLLFNPGDTIKNINVTVNGDTQPEANESFYVRIGLPENAVVIDSIAIGTIRNDDSASLISESSMNKSIQSTSLATKSKVYPNPAKDILYIQSKGDAIFYLSDATGKTIITKPINGNGSMDVSKIPAGLYYLKNTITDEMQKIIIEK